jgi:hypothetical protein
MAEGIVADTNFAKVIESMFPMGRAEDLVIWIHSYLP